MYYYLALKGNKAELDQLNTNISGLVFPLFLKTHRDKFYMRLCFSQSHLCEKSDNLVIVSVVELKNRSSLCF